MVSSDGSERPLRTRSLLRAVELVLAAQVLLIVAVLAAQLSPPYPAWPTVWGVPVDPELVVPGVLGVVALLSASVDGLGVGSLVVGALGFLTLGMASLSLYSLYTTDGGGVFWGGFVTLAVGLALAVAVVVRAVVDLIAPGLVSDPLRDLFDEI